MPSYCVVSNCEYKYAFSTNISFHKFPFHSPVLLQQWIEFVERGPTWMPSRWSRVCSSHFTSDDFKENIYRKCLKRTAVPSIKKKLFNFTITQSFDEEDEPIVNEDILAAGHQLQQQIIDDVCAININESIVNYTTGQQHVQTQSLHHKMYEITCRLCAQTISDINGNIQSIDDTAIMSIFTKCFPTITLELCDNYPTKICNDCLMKLKQFSQFVERVQAAQYDFTNGNSIVNQFTSLPQVIATTTTTSTTNKSINDNNNANNSNHKYITTNNTNEPIIRDTSKAIVIKQEPFVNVKQEVIDFSRTGTTLRLQDNFLPNTDAYCEFCDAYFINNFELKNHIVNYHSSRCRENATKTANNCEIMEIITLDNIMMIDLVGKSANNRSDTIANDEEMIESPSSPIAMPCPATILKVETLNDLEQRENLSKFVLTEHSYFKSSTINENSSILACKPVVKVLKQEDGVQMQQQQQQQHQTVYAAQSTTTAPIFDELLDAAFESIVEPKSCIDNDIQPQINVIEEIIGAESDIPLISPKICAICFQEFFDIYQYLVHKKIYHSHNVAVVKKWNPKRFSAMCQDCSVQFHTKLAYTNHRNYMCPVRRGITYQCPYCRLNFVQWLEMRQHSKKCCANNATQAVSQLKDIGVQCDSMPDNVSQYACEQCGRCYTRPSNLRRHKALHRPREQWDEKCAYCGTVFDKRYDLARHISQGDCPNAVEKKRLEKDKHKNDTPVVCPVCNKKFRTAKSLHQHKYTHSDVRRYKCTLCTKVFKRIAGLNQHIRGFHHKIKPFKCPVCKYCYALKGDLNRCKHSSLNGYEINEN